MDQSYLKYECKAGSFSFALNNKNISEWKSTGIYNRSTKSSMNAVANAKTDLPNFKNDGRMHVHLNGNHFQQIVAGIPNNDNVINIYCVYKLDPLASNRDKSYTIQNALFGAMQITKNATDYDKNNYKGYGICFDERSEFGHTITEGGNAHTTDATNVLIFLVYMQLIEQTIYILWVQGLRKVLMILRYMQKRTFTETLQILVKNLC